MRAILRLLLLLLVASGAEAAPQDKAQQKCITGFEKSAAKLSKAAGRLALKCVQDAAKKGTSVDRIRAMKCRVSMSRMAKMDNKDFNGLIDGVIKEMEAEFASL